MLARIRRRTCRRTAERILNRAHNDRAMSAAVADYFNEFSQSDLSDRRRHALAGADSDPDYYSP
ncbi:hypothetical protein AWC14_01175 [Mycobacterium kyorinense]|uniref:Uncharacterized protein n=1 Tax=Mycobacterium kyorinense TaxID=487514 RepID=A0A1X1YM97_9MYCO|nr:hypothetical protein AWC14_01175 [Mycobacterium kyorinense]